MRGIKAVPDERVPAIANAVTEQPGRNDSGTGARPLLRERVPAVTLVHCEGKDGYGRRVLAVARVIIGRRCLTTTTSSSPELAPAGASLPPASPKTRPSASS